MILKSVIICQSREWISSGKLFYGSRCVFVPWLRHNVSYLAIRPSFLPACRPSVCSFVTNFVNTMFWKRMNSFCCKLVQVVHGARVRNDQLLGQEVKGQGHTTPKLDLEAWRRHNPSRTQRSTNFSYPTASTSHYIICSESVLCSRS